jgi:shikimate kinase
MTIFLTGFMGTGKTTVGRKLAERLGIPFVDTDQMIERSEGRPITTIFAMDGESYFRAIERQAIEDAPVNAVVATGGGAMIDPLNRRRMRATGTIICLSADADTIYERTAGDGDRPLLAGEDPRKSISKLLAQRAPAYAEADCIIDTSNIDAEAVVDTIVEFLEDRCETEEPIR